MAHIISPHNYDLIFFEKLGKAAFPGLPPEQFEGMRIAAKHRVLFKEALAEKALANASKGLYKRISSRADFDDLSDCKTGVVVRRQNCYKRGQWTSSIKFTKVKGKPGGLRLVGHDPHNDEWHFLAVPFEAYQHLNTPLELNLETYSGYFDQEPPWGTRQAECHWNRFRVKSFTALAKHEF